jgi:tetratricopeptide (TPR) repeat protein
LLSFILACGLTVVPGLAQSQPAGAPAAAELARQAQELLRSGKPAEAQALLQRVVRLAPQSAQAHALLGDADAQLGKTAEAIREYETVLKLRPNYPPVLFNLGILQYRAGKFAPAAAYLESFHRQSPEDLSVLLPLAECFFQLGRRQQGVKALQTAMAGANNSPVMLMKAGELLLSADLPGDAVKPLERALALAPSSDECRLALALAQSRLHQYQDVVNLLADHPKADEPAFAVLLGPALCRLQRCGEAVPRLEKAVEIDSADRRLYLELAEAYAASAEKQKAIRTLQSAYHLFPQAVDVRVALAEALLGAGDPGQAAMLLEQAEGEPLAEPGLRLLAQCYLALDRQPEAEQAARRAASGNAPEEASLLGLANIYLLEGRDPEIIKLLEAQRQRFAKSARYLFTLGLSYYNVGNYAAASELAGKAIANDPQFAQAQYLAGNSLSSLGKLEEAISHYQAAASLAPANFLYHQYLGIVLARVGKKEPAEAELKESIQLNGSHAPARFELAKLYFAQGRNDLAREELEQTTRIDPEFESSYYLLSRVYASLGRNEEAGASLKQFRAIQQKRREEARALKERESPGKGETAPK